MITRDDKVIALSLSTGTDLHRAEIALRLLESKGLTIYRKKVMRNERRPVSSEPMTPELRAKIRHAYRFSEMTQAEIAAAFHVNLGRVAEVLGSRY